MTPPLPQTLKIYKNQNLSPHAFITLLLDQGYQRVNQVHDPGDCALRGGILDIFPEGFEAPVRVEFTHETVSHLKSIHPLTGAPFFSHEMVMILPAVSFHRRPVKAPLKHLFLGEESPLDPFVDIHPRDLVVHVTYGIGRYLGIKKVRVKDRIVEHMVLEYAEGDRLSIPVTQMHLVQKYMGFEGRPPKLSRLGTRYWDRSKEAARKGAASVAGELLSLQAKRMSQPGHAYAPDTDWQKELEAAFPYQETAGQIQAMREIKADMESNRTMDRLLTGDVGYGKTEMALRAAFKACMDNRQTALLCPTTILAEQHYATFSRRLAPYPVSVAMLSRFQSSRAQAQVIQGLREGRVDICIGTHRLLSKDVQFKDLGFLVIDEEQRFGVRHKELLKGLRLGVDILALTATPIPRTLYLALMGVRSLSTIDTPPFERLSVKTVVAEEEDASIRRALREELKRDGQIFVIYPWIEGLEKVYRRMCRLVPQARISVAHGQMPSRALEKAMIGFMKREVDILVSTAIVESGIDVPNANTLVVFRADSFGLADLYQLRGRVGRGSRQAAAFFLTPKGMPLTEEAQKRLNALREFSGFGAGFHLALRDLQLRGAGNILGLQQHGHIMAVGFDLYCRLLKTEVDRLKALVPAASCVVHSKNHE